jgi:hypothetical protein
MNSIHQLKELQNIDNNLSEIRSYLGDLPVKVEELKSKETQLISELEKGKDRLKHIEVELNKIEVEIAAAKDKINSLKDQLFKVGNNRQYDALMTEIDHLKESVDQMETNDLELMEEKSQLKEKVKTQEESLDELTSDLSTRRGKLESTIAESGDRKEKLEQERNSKREEIPQSLLSRYDRILKAKKGLAVVSVDGKACEGCGSAIPPQIISYVKMKSNLYNCDVCGRFLFWEEKQSEIKN